MQHFRQFRWERGASVGADFELNFNCFFTCSRIVLNSEGEEENKKSLISLLEKTISSQDLPAAVLSFFISVFSQSAPPEDSTQLFI